MPNAESISSELVKKFSYLGDKIKIQRANRLWVDTGKVCFGEVLDFLYKDLKFDIICTMTGLDAGEDLAFIYHLAHEDGTVLNLKRSASKENPVITTVTHYFPGAAIYEREVVDLLGARVEGLPPGPRYPLPDDFPKDQYPLRKDWKGLESKGAKEEKKA